MDENHLVTGPPGTGKTIMALYRATSLYEGGYDPLLLMHGRLLAGYTGAAARARGVEDCVATFHSWFYRWFTTTTGSNVPEVEAYRPDWRAVQKALEGHDWVGSLPYLLVDEAQDFAPAFHAFCATVARRLTLYADQNQRISSDNATLEEIAANTGITSVHRLTRNYRNTREIAEVAAHFFVGQETGIPDLPERRGDRPVLSRHRDITGAVDAVRRWEAINPDLHIGVFVPTTRMQDRVLAGLKGKTINEVQAYKGGSKQGVDFGRPGVVVITHQSAKGLEFDSVFIPELQDVRLDDGGDEFRMRMYVLCSRAREHLFLSFSGEGAPAILAHLPIHAMEMR